MEIFISFAVDLQVAISKLLGTSLKVQSYQQSLAAQETLLRTAGFRQGYILPPDFKSMFPSSDSMHSQLEPETTLLMLMIVVRLRDLTMLCSAAFSLKSQV